MDVGGEGGEEKLAIGEQRARVRVVECVDGALSHIASVQFFRYVWDLILLPVETGEFIEFAAS